jgi:hypothetical protein
MPKCTYCGVETMLHINGVPVCVSCDDSKAMVAARLPKEQNPENKSQPPAQTGIRSFNGAGEKDREQIGPHKS